jgi:hypothetical protein
MRSVCGLPEETDAKIASNVEPLRPFDPANAAVTELEAESARIAELALENGLETVTASQVNKLIGQSSKQKFERLLQESKFTQRNGNILPRK